MSFEESSKAVRQKLAKMTDTDPNDWYLCMKARFGMALVFNALRDIKGYGDVITTPYTCITSINPILTSGLKPVYADIDPEFLSTTSVKSALVRPRTLALVMQHTLGMIGDKTKLAKFAEDRNLLLVEDSAHCVTRMARTKSGRILADISVHSFGVEKVLTTTKFGGAVYVNPTLKKKNKELYEQICVKLGQLKEPGRLLNLRVKTYRFHNGVLQRMPQFIKPSFRSLQIKLGLLEPAVYPFEQEAQQDEPKNTNTFVNEKMLEGLGKLKLNYTRRETNVGLYNKHLKSTHFKNLTSLNEPLLAYPILFKDQQKAQAAYEMLTSSGYFIRRWYYPLIYPGPKSTKRYYYKPEMAPVAEDVSKRVLCLPTDLPAIETQKIIKLISQDA
jgi:dTDP-4-amino-4,6-dideoxygalactose transaminase